MSAYESLAACYDELTYDIPGALRWAFARRDFIDVYNLGVANLSEARENLTILNGLYDGEVPALRVNFEARIMARYTKQVIIAYDATAPTARRRSRDGYFRARRVGCAGTAHYRRQGSG